MSKLNIALAKAYAATAEAFELLGGAGAGANPRRENAPAARAKLIEAQALLDAAAPGSAYPRDRFAVLYAHSDYLRAMNLYLLGSLETDWQQTDRFWAPSVEHAESGYEISLRYISDPAFLQNARNCATLAIQLHHVLIVSAALNSDDEGMAYHKVRESELKAWLEKSLSNQ